MGSTVKKLALSICLLFAFVLPAFALSTIYVDATNGVSTNSGTTNGASPTANGTNAVVSVSSGTTQAATSSFTTAGSTFTIAAACGTTFVAGMGVWDATLAATLGSGQTKAMIGVVASCSGAGPSTITLTDNAQFNSAGSADSLFFSNKITLDTNTNLTSVTGCATKPSTVNYCDGTQAINLASATNSNLRIFWLSSYTGCSGSGSCVITVAGSTSQATATYPTCAGGPPCTAMNWAVGGQYIWPTSNTVDVVAKALRPGDTLQFNCAGGNPATKTLAAPFITMASNGDQITGPIIVQGETGCRPLLQQSGSVNVIANTSNNIIYSNFEIKQTGTATLCIAGNTNLNVIYSNLKISQCAGTNADGINIGAGSMQQVLFSEITGATGNGVNSIGVNGYFFGNYIHGNSLSGILLSAAGVTATVANNVISGNTTRGIFFSGSPATNSGRVAQVLNNTVYNNTGNGMEVTSGAAVLYWMNNIFQQNGGGANFNVSWAATGSAAEQAGYHAYNLFYTSSCAGGAAGACLNNVTRNGFGGSTEPTPSDALFTSAGTGDFSLLSLSPAKGAAFPGALLGSASTGALSMGAVQPAGGGGGGIICAGCN